MSHVVSSETVITDLDCLKAALTAFPGLEFRENQKTYEWFGEWVNDYRQDDAAYKRGISTDQYGKCEHAIHMQDVAYEIGVTKRNDGAGYSLVWDFYGCGRKINDLIGKNAEKLMVEYQKEFCSRYARAEGFMCNQTEDEENVYVEMMQ